MAWNPTASNAMKPYWQTLRSGFLAVEPCFPEQYFQMSSVITVQLGNYLLSTWKRYSLTAQHINKTL